jgi:hypothetical protein
MQNKILQEMQISRWFSKTLTKFSILLSLLVNSGCTPLPPPIPELLANLPTQGETVCDNSLRHGGYTLWSKPAIPAADSDSEVVDKGNRQGIIMPCEPVKITDIVWSIGENHYYVFVEGDNEQGWLCAEYIHVE